MKDCNCIFCKIANGEIPSSTVYEDEDFRVILDLGPASKGHALILPKEHFKDVTELDPKIAAKGHTVIFLCALNVLCFCLFHNVTFFVVTLFQD